MDPVFGCCCECPQWRSDEVNALYYENVTKVSGSPPTGCGPSYPPDTDACGASGLSYDYNCYQRCIRALKRAEDNGDGTVTLVMDAPDVMVLEQVVHPWRVDVSGVAGISGVLPVTDTGTSGGYQTLIVDGGISPTGQNAGSVGLNLDYSSCDKTGFKGAMARGHYLGSPPFNAICGDCATIAARHYLTKRFVASYAYNQEGQPSLSGTFDQTIIIDKDTGQLSITNCSGDWESTLTLPWGGRAIMGTSYCDCGGEEPCIGWTTYSGQGSTDGTAGSLGCPGSFDSEDCWGPWDEFSPDERGKWKWSVGTSGGDCTSIRYQVAVEMRVWRDGVSAVVSSTFTDTEVTLSNPQEWGNGVTGVYAETLQRLDEWDFSDDVLYPWRTDFDCRVVPYAIKDTVPNKHPSYTTDCSATAAGGTGVSLGEPLPSYAGNPGAVLGPHFQFFPDKCGYMPSIDIGLLPLATTYWTTNSPTWGGFATYNAGTQEIVVQKWAIAFAGCPLSSELLTSSITGSGAGWSGDYTGWTHTAGSAVTLVTTLAPKNDRGYYVVATITDRTAGSIQIQFGGQTSPSLVATGNWSLLTTSTAALKVIPTSDFNGKVVLSVKLRPVGDHAFLSWVNDGCGGTWGADPYNGFSCDTRRHTRNARYPFVACVSSSPTDVFGGGVTLPIQMPPAKEVGIGSSDAGWYCHPWFYRPQNSVSEPSVEYNCADCYSCTGGTSGCQSSTGAEPYCISPADGPLGWAICDYTNGSPQNGDPFGFVTPP